MRVVFTANSIFALTNFRLNLIQRIVELGHSVVAIVPQSENTDELEKLGIEIVTVDLSRGRTSLQREFELLIRIFIKLQKVKPDLVLSFTIKNNIYFGICCRLLNIHFMPNITGLGSIFQTKTLMQKLVIALYKFSIKKSRITFFQNSSDRDLFLSKKILHPRQVCLLPGSGVDLSKFRYQKLNLTHELKFLMISRLIKTKGIEEFIVAAKVVHREFPNAHFILVGPIDTENPDAITPDDLTKLLSDSPVKYMGSTAKVKDYISKSACVVLPSYYPEGTPRVLLEGGAMGRALITTKMPGCEDTLEDGITGFLCLPKDIDSLADAFRSFATLSPVQRVEMGERSSLFVTKKFDERIVISKYEKLIDEIKLYQGI